MADDDKKGRQDIKNPKGRPPNPDKASVEKLEGIKAAGEAAANESKVQSQLNEVANKLAEQGLSADDKSFKEQNQALKAIQNSLKTNPGNASIIEESLEKLKTLEEAADKNLEAQKEAIANDKVVRSLEDLVEENKRTTKLLESDSNAQLELNHQIKQLNNGFYSGEFFNDPEADARALALQESYDKASADLKGAIESGDQQAQDLAMKQLEQIKESAESEENQREARKMNQLANDRLFQIADGVERTADGMQDAISGAMGTAGILAGLVGLALLFIDPETFTKIVDELINQVGGVIDLIKGIISGDMDMIISGLGDSWQLMLGVLLALAPLVVGKLAKLVKGIKVFRVFMMGSFIPGMISAFSGMIAAITPMLAAMAPILLPILAVAALFGAIYLGLEAMRKAMGFTSIFDVVLLGLAYLKDGFAHVGNFFINLAEGFVNSLSWLTPILDWLGVEAPDFANMEFERMSTDNAVRKEAELKQKAADAELEKTKEKTEDIIEGDYDTQGNFMPKNVGSDIDPVSGLTWDELRASAPVQPRFDADQIANMSSQNELEKVAPKGGDAIVTNVTRQGNTTTTTTSVTTIQAPLTRASGILGSVTAR